MTIDHERLVGDCEDIINQPIFTDEHGEGVALLDGTVYPTWAALAEGFELDIEDYMA